MTTLVKQMLDDEDFADNSAKNPNLVGAVGLEPTTNQL
jgi:hypothetical protein